MTRVRIKRLQQDTKSSLARRLLVLVGVSVLITLFLWQGKATLALISPVVGIGFSVVLLTLVVYFAQIAQQRRKQIKAIARALANEVIQRQRVEAALQQSEQQRSKELHEWVPTSQSPPLPEDEAARLDALRQYEILDTEAEEVFDDFTRLVAYICGTPIALVSLTDESRQWFKSKVGWDVDEISRDLAFCAHAILQPNEVLIVPDTLDDPRFAANPLVTSDPRIRFYAGAPLNTSEQYALGTLCVLDRKPRQLSPEQVEALQTISRQVVAQLELRRNLANAAQTTAQLKQVEQQRIQLLAQEQAARAETQIAQNQVITLLESVTDAFYALDNEWRFTYLNRHAELLLQKTRSELVGKNMWLEFPAALGTSFEREYYKAVSEQISVEFEEFYLPFNKWLEVHAYPSKDGLFVYFQDITNRKQTAGELQRQNLRSQLFGEVTLKIRQSLRIEEILQTTVTEVQQLLQADRVVVYRLLGADGFGKVVTEAVLPDWSSVIDLGVTDDCFGTEHLRQYHKGRVYAVADVEKSEVSSCLVEFLRQFGVKAKLVVPISLQEQLWGLLIAHQCSKSTPLGQL